MFTISNKVKIRKIRERGKIRKTWSMTKKRSSEIFAAKMEIFSEKNVILVGEKIFRPPKLGARFPLLDGLEVWRLRLRGSADSLYLEDNLHILCGAAIDFEAGRLDLIRYDTLPRHFEVNAS